MFDSFSGFLVSRIEIFGWDQLTKYRFEFRNVLIYLFIYFCRVCYVKVKFCLQTLPSFGQLFKIISKREREREREREKERERQRERQTDRQIDIQTDRQTDRQTD